MGSSLQPRSKSFSLANCEVLVHSSDGGNPAGLKREVSSSAFAARKVSSGVTGAAFLVEYVSASPNTSLLPAQSHRGFPSSLFQPQVQNCSLLNLPALRLLVAGLWAAV